MKREFEQKLVREYLEIIRNPDRRFARYNRMKVGLWLMTLVLGVALYLSRGWCWLDSELRIVHALITGALFMGAYVVGYSLAQQPLIVRYMDADALEERLRELDA